MEEIAVVTKKLDNGMIELEIKRNSACGDCKACGNSSESNKHIIILKDTINAQPGDTVLLSTESKNILKYTLIVYAIPFAFLIIGMILGYYLSSTYNLYDADIFSFILGMLFLAFSYLILRLIDNKYYKNNDNILKISKKI
ncbi:MAG TPA: SoxR reducing system RseC family protein [Soehngenia sp.]|nr:SoxR reducing system RseC family protein [Soehngenia sp.]HPP31346.1 SoxR reducing system RseC family protein [Soehngenia sp.]